MSHITFLFCFVMEPLDVVQSVYGDGTFIRLGRPVGSDFEILFGPVKTPDLSGVCPKGFRNFTLKS